MHILLFAILFCPLTALQAEDVSGLVKQLDSTDSRVRFDAARELTWTGAKAEPATTRLLELLGDDDAPFEHAVQYFGPRVNDAASGALAEIGEPAVAGLIEALQSEDRMTRMKAAETLGKIGPPAARSFPMLIKFLSESEPDADATFEHRMDFYDRQLAIIKALAEIGAPASPTLPELRRLAAEKENLWLSDAAGEAIWKIEKSQTDPRSRIK